MRELIASADVLAASAREVLARVRPAAPAMPADTLAVAQLVGPLLGEILIRSAPFSRRQLRLHVEQLLRAWGG